MSCYRKTYYFQAAVALPAGHKTLAQTRLCEKQKNLVNGYAAVRTDIAYRGCLNPLFVGDQLLINVFPYCTCDSARCTLIIN